MEWIWWLMILFAENWGKLLLGILAFVIIMSVYMVYIETKKLKIHKKIENFYKSWASCVNNKTFSDLDSYFEKGSSLYKEIINECKELINKNSSLELTKIELNTLHYYEDGSAEVKVYVVYTESTPKGKVKLKEFLYKFTMNIINYEIKITNRTEL